MAAVLISALILRAAVELVMPVLPIILVAFVIVSIVAFMFR